MRRPRAGVLINQYGDVELADSAAVKMLVGFENPGKLGQAHELQVFSREIRFRLHDLPCRARRIGEDSGKGFFLAILCQHIGDKINPEAIRER